MKKIFSISSWGLILISTFLPNLVNAEVDKNEILNMFTNMLSTL